MSKHRFDLMQELRFLVARFANWFCGPAVLFWTNPEVWEEYIEASQSNHEPTE